MVFGSVYGGVWFEWWCIDTCTTMWYYGDEVIGMSTIQDERHNSVVKANALIQKSRYSLSAQQQKIILFLISKITPYDDEFKYYNFSIPEFCRICGIDCSAGKNYADLKNAVKELRDRSVWIDLEDGRQATVSWLDRPFIDPGSGTIQVKLDDLMKPYLLHLKENFTRYDLLYALHFKSKYSIRLYELIQSVHYHDRAEYSCVFDIDDLKERCGAETYKYRDFKKGILELALKEINQYSEKNVKYEEIKRGKKVIAVEFSISSKEFNERLKVEDMSEKEMGETSPSIWDQIQALESSDNRDTPNQTPPYLYKP